MSNRNRRILSYLGLVAGTVLVLTIAYNLGMAAWEDRPQPLYRSFEVVVQSLTTTGYGEDAPWQSPYMNGLVIVTQLAGIGLIFTAVDLFVVPWLRTTLAPSAPEQLEGLEDHVVICGHTPRTDRFISELDARDQPYVLIESDEESAGRLHENGYRVIQGNPESAEALERAGIGVARAVVADVADDVNASIALTAREERSAVPVITLVEDEGLGRYHQMAGADTVLSPRQILGKSLASQIPTAVTTRPGEGISIGRDFELAEFALGEGSGLHDQSLREARVRQQFGVNVIGAWIQDDFATPVDPDTVLSSGTRLLVAGLPEQLDALREATASSVRQFSPQHTILAGFGDSGRAAFEALRDTGSELTVVDIVDADGVDVVGDACDPTVLEEAGMREADSVLFALESDTMAVFATLVARDLNDRARIVVRANQEEDVPKLYRAGADYVQSLASISGRMLASTIFEDEEVLTYGLSIRVVRVAAPGLAGSTIADAAVRTRTGCTVIAVMRNDRAITDFDPDTFIVGEDDEVVIAGTDDAVNRFEGRFG